MATALFCLSGAGMAQDRDGDWYASLRGAFVVPQDLDWTDPTGSVDIPMKNGFGILAAIGRSLSSGLGAELELGYREYDIDVPTGSALQGNFSTVSLMANGIYSFDLEGFRPYAGLGVGLARNTTKLELRVRGAGSAEDTGEANVFAYQALAGIGYRLSDRTEVSLGYRYFGSAKGDFGSDVEIASTHHNFEVGLLYRF